MVLGFKLLIKLFINMIQLTVLLVLAGMDPEILKMGWVPGCYLIIFALILHETKFSNKNLYPLYPPQY